MKTADAPVYRSRCVYCGELEPEPHMSCCGERHFQDEPECPMCGDFVEQIKGSVHGIETHVWQCQSCDWTSDPE